MSSQEELFAETYPVERLSMDGSLMDFGPVFSGEEAEAIFGRLMAEVPWRRDTAFLYGRRITTKRKVAWFGDGEFAYSYSNTTRTALPWTPLLRELRDRVVATSGGSYNSVLLNLYHDGSEGMNWHSDDEKELGLEPRIASLSFGATRRFDMRHKESQETVRMDLSSGGLIVMSGKSQSHWKHQVPKQLRVKSPRVNLTFRMFAESRKGVT